MADAQRLCWQRKHGASQVVLLRDRTSIHRVDRVRSCELKGRLTLRVIGRSVLQNHAERIPAGLRGCNLCSRSDLSPMFPAART